MKSLRCYSMSLIDELFAGLNNCIRGLLMRGIVRQCRYLFDIQTTGCVKKELLFFPKGSGAQHLKIVQLEKPFLLALHHFFSKAGNINFPIDAKNCFRS